MNESSQSSCLETGTLMIMAAVFLLVLFTLHEEMFSALFQS